MKPVRPLTVCHTCQAGQAAHHLTCMKAQYIYMHMQLVDILRQTTSRGHLTTLQVPTVPGQIVRRLKKHPYTSSEERGHAWRYSSRPLFDGTRYRANVLFALPITHLSWFMGWVTRRHSQGAPKAGIGIYKRRKVSPIVSLGDF